MEESETKKARGESSYPIMRAKRQVTHHTSTSLFLPCLPPPSHRRVGGGRLIKRHSCNKYDTTFHTQGGAGGGRRDAKRFQNAI